MAAALSMYDRSGAPSRNGRGHRDHRHVEVLARDLVDGGLVAAGGDGARELGVGDVLDVGVAGVEPAHALVVELVADHAVPDLDRPHGERQPHVALSDHNDVHQSVVLRESVRREARVTTPLCRA